jgi:hypothetical protein
MILWIDKINKTTRFIGKIKEIDIEETDSGITFHILKELSESSNGMISRKSIEKNTRWIIMADNGQPLDSSDRLNTL